MPQETAGPCPRSAWIAPEASVASTAVCHAGSWIGPGVRIGAGAVVAPGAVIGLIGPDGVDSPVQIGERVWIGPGVCIEPGVTIGDGSRVDAGSVLRAGTVLGKEVRIGVRCTCMGHCRVNDRANLTAEVHVGEFSTLEEHCQLMPGCCLLNDPYPPTALAPMGPTVGACAIIGVGAVIYPGVKLGFHSMVGALAIAKKDVPDYMLVTGQPAEEICDVRRIRYKVRDQWVYPYPWMRCNVPGEDITQPSPVPRTPHKRRGTSPT